MKKILNVLIDVDFKISKLIAAIIYRDPVQFEAVVIQMEYMRDKIKARISR